MACMVVNCIIPTYFGNMEIKAVVTGKIDAYMTLYVNRRPYEMHTASLRRGSVLSWGTLF